jgi:hypothetical protein
MTSADIVTNIDQRLIDAKTEISQLERARRALIDR